MIHTLKKNIHLLIVALYGYILFYKIKTKDYTSMLLLTLFTSVLILQLRKRSMIEGQENELKKINKGEYVEKSENTSSNDKSIWDKMWEEEVKKKSGKTTKNKNIKAKNPKAKNPKPLTLQKTTKNKNIKSAGEEDINTTIMDMKLNDESKDIKTFGDSIRIGAYDGLCLSSIQKDNKNEIITNEQLNTYFGHILPRKAKKTIDEPLTGPSVDGSEDSPTKLSVFANNKTSLNCCGDSPFSTTTGCVCLTEKQKKYIQNRGFNKKYEEL